MNISKEQLDAVKNFKNTDFSDCPVLTDEQLAQMQPCHIVAKSSMWKPRTEILNMRIDADVLAGLRNTGKGWQARVNDYLRRGLITNSI
ncbi:MAG: BrnA antitoxin family protein [Treponema sp.]|nr:BrnA antitoxin family protein [Treponema sp.]